MAINSDSKDMNPIETPPGQHFECRDCPSRCCVAPWRVPISEKEKERFEGQEWIQERLRTKKVDFFPLGDGRFGIPTVVRGKQLVCVFLDEDGGCSQYKRHGFEFWSLTCQSFPYEFVKLQGGRVVANLSHYCPSIRDNYGKPVAEQVDKYFVAADQVAAPLASNLQVGESGRLTQRQYLQLAQVWQNILQEPGPLSSSLLAIYEVTDALGEAVLDTEEVTDDEFALLLDQASRSSRPPLLTARSQSFLANVLLSSTLLPLSYPLRMEFGDGFSLSRFLQTYSNLFPFLRNRGEMDLLYLPAPFLLEKAARIRPDFIEAGAEGLLKHFFLQVVDRHRLFLASRSILECVLDLAVAYALILRFARYRAASENRSETNRLDYAEGVSVAEFLVLYHSRRTPQQKFVRMLFEIAAGNRLSFEGILFSEGI